MIELKYKPLEVLEITSRYGIRVFGGLEFHPGVDYKVPLGTNIHAVDDGKVVVAKNDADGYGLYIVIEHSNYCTLYAHLKSLLLEVGQVVKAGDVIGQVGMTGMITGPHLHFEIRDCLYDAYFWLKSILKGRHVMCIDPEDLVREAKDIPAKIEYKKYKNGMTELKGDVKDLRIKVVDKIIWNITEYTNCTNGTFYWHNLSGKTYATSILYQDGIVYQNVADHFNRFGCPQSVFIVYNDNTVDLKKIYLLSELDLSKIRLVVGGVGLRNTQDKNFVYNPEGEGFKKDINKITGKTEDQSGVLAKRNKTVLGYNKRLNKCYLLTVPNISHTELIKSISQGEEYYDIAISLDGGGSTFMDALGKYVFKGQALRRIHNIIGFGL